MCQRCEDLEEEVAYYRTELGISDDNDRYASLRNAMREAAKGHRIGGHGSVELVRTLYQAGGRVLTRWQILEAVPPTDRRGEDERNPKIVDVWVCATRKSLGHEAIENVWGRGYRLTPFGLDLVGRILGHVEPIPEVKELQDRPPEELRSMAALIAGLLAHKDGDGGTLTAITYRRIAERLTGQPRVAA